MEMAVDYGINTPQIRRKSLACNGCSVVWCAKSRSKRARARTHALGHGLARSPKRGVGWVCAKSLVSMPSTLDNFFGIFLESLGLVGFVWVSPKGLVWMGRGLGF
jgi:hypothetical protein